MSSVFKVMISSASLISVISTGFILSRLGRPYNQFIFNLHKLIALTAIVFTVIYMRGQHLLSDAGLVTTIAIVIAVLSIAALFVTGALLSIGKIDQTLLNRIHLPTAIALTCSLVVILRDALVRL